VELIVGADIGGTSTKVALMTHEGTLVRYATAPGGNIRSSAGSVAQNIATALRSAIRPDDLAQVTHGLFGIAGAGPARHAEVSEQARLAWRQAGLHGTLTVRTDLEIAYASAARSPHGLLVLAGTGAVSCRFVDLRITGRCDGMGWLLGDEGSAVWIGLCALTATAAALDHRGEDTALVPAILGHLGIDSGRVGADLRQDLIGVVYSLPPARFGELAPVTVDCAEEGDPVAKRIVDHGVEALLRSARGAVSDSGASLPAPAEVVLAGSLLTTSGPIRRRVTDRLTATLSLPVVPAHTPVVGALRLAARELGLPEVDRDRLSAQMTDRLG